MNRVFNNVMKSSKYWPCMANEIVKVCDPVRMQVNKDAAETELHQAFIVNANASGFTFGDDDRPERVIKSFFISTAAFLSNAKVAKIDQAVALILTDVAGTFKFGAVVEYHENAENPDEPGNWSLTFTFNEEDIEELEKSKSVKKLLYSSTEFKALFSKIAYDVASIEFQHDSYLYDACLMVVDTITQVLERESAITGKADVEFDGCFVASVAVEDDGLVFGIVPDGKLKEIIKDDSSLDV